MVEPPKVVAASVGVRNAKSPGWSRVVGAKKDLKDRHVSLNITGGETRANQTIMEKTCTLKSQSSNKLTLPRSQLPSSGESSVEIDDQSQKVDCKDSKSTNQPQEDVENVSFN